MLMFYLNFVCSFKTVMYNDDISFQLLGDALFVTCLNDTYGRECQSCPETCKVSK